MIDQARLWGGCAWGQSFVGKGVRVRIFISYARVDHEPVQELVACLQMGAHEPWHDFEIHTGQIWKEVLLQQITQCEVFLYVLTPDSVKSGWCRWEYGQAVNMDKPIFPLMLRNVTIPNELSSIQEIQFLDARNGFTGRVIAKLMGDLQSHLQRVRTPVNIPEPPSPHDEIPSRADLSTMEEITKPEPHFMAPRNVENIMLKAVLKGHTAEVMNAAIDSRGRYLVTASGDQTMRFWDLRNFQTVRSPVSFDHGVLDVAFSPDSSVLAVATHASYISLWDLRENKWHRLSGAHQNAVHSIAFSENGRFLASGSRDTNIQVWEVQKRRRWERFRGHRRSVHAVAFSPDTSILASASKDGEIKLWDMHHRSAYDLLDDHQGDVSALAFAPNGLVLASASRDQTVRLWDVKERMLRDVLDGHEGWVRSVAYSPNGKLLATAADDGTVRLWDARRRQALKVLRGHTESVREVAFSPLGNLFVSVSADGTARVWGLDEKPAEA